MLTYGIAFVVTAFVFLTIDAIWLFIMSKLLYRPLLGSILLSQFKLMPAAIFYVLYIFGIVFLAIGPALSSGHWQEAALRGAVLGLVAYGTYDLTNQATLKGWSGLITIADLCWGTFVTAASAVSGFLLVTFAFKA